MGIATQTEKPEDSENQELTRVDFWHGQTNFQKFQNLNFFLAMWSCAITGLPYPQTTIYH